MARVRLNDAIQSIGGDVLTDTQPFSQVIVNGAFRRMQEFLANLGFSRLNREVIISNCPVVAVTDPAVQTYIDWSNYFDGSSYYQTPVLPADFISPLKMWERQTGVNQIFPVHPNMENMLDGLPGGPKVGRNRFWQWREDKIWMPGAQFSMDLRILYAAYLADFMDTGVDPNIIRWYQQPVPITRCLSPFASYIAYEMSSARGDEDAATLKAEAEAETRLIFNRDVRAKQRVNVRRRAANGHRYGSGASFIC